METCCLFRYVMTLNRAWFFHEFRFTKSLTLCGKQLCMGYYFRIKQVCHWPIKWYVWLDIEILRNTMKYIEGTVSGPLLRKYSLELLHILGNIVQTWNQCLVCSWLFWLNKLWPHMTSKFLNFARNGFRHRATCQDQFSKTVQISSLILFFESTLSAMPALNSDDPRSHKAHKP